MDDENRPRFEITQDEPPSQVVLAGVSQFGLAGLTAVDFLTRQLDLEPTGHVDARGLPTVTPFDEGRPRHHTRLFSRSDLDVTVLAGELFVPVGAAPPFCSAVLDWVDANDVREVVVLSGVPVPHGPEEHRTFYVATDDYREHRLADADVPPMGTGFLDGVNGGLVERGMTTDLEVCVLATPVHARAPDVEAAIRLVETAGDLYELAVDTGPLEAFAADVSRYYAELQSRMERQTDRPDRSMPEDRMFM